MASRAVPAALAAICALAAGCASSPSTKAAASRTSPSERAAAVGAGTLTRPLVTATTPCAQYPAATYGIDPGGAAQTGGGSQLVTVVAPSRHSLAGTLVAWSRQADGCWAPAVFAGLPAQPYRAETGYGGLVPFAERQPFDGTTPTGLFTFGTVVYGVAPVSPTTQMAYHQLLCGDWWDEEPGSPTYDSFQHVACGTTPPFGNVSEALWTEPQPYQHFIDIPMPNPPDHVAGIFLHDDTTAGDTAGCVALPNAELDAVLGWLNPADDPHILIAVG